MQQRFKLRRRLHFRPTGSPFTDSGDDNVFTFADGTTADIDNLEALANVVDTAPGRFMC